MPAVSVLCLAIIVGGVISTVHDDLVARGFILFLWTFAVVFCHNSLGYLLGWFAGRLAGFNVAKKRTISLEVGMQNAGLATVLASNFFASQPLAVLPCAISCAWHSISGTILSGLYLRWDLRHPEIAKALSEAAAVQTEATAETDGEPAMATETVTEEKNY